ncbi:MAG: hypothetical protein EOM12_03485 [Verrucomicrobiae bacterium]|nr:hypothetical protein [Verrucomicrobiae bacterium]
MENEELELCMQAIVRPEILHKAKAEGVGEKTFITPEARLLWSEMVLCASKYPLNAPTLIRHLKHRGLWDDIREFADVSSGGTEFGNDDQLIETIRGRYLEDTLRSLIRKTDNAMRQKEDVPDIVSFLFHSLPDLLPRRSEETDVVALIENELNRKRGLTSQFHLLANAMDYDGLVILAARPSDGKTTFVVNENEFWSRKNRVDIFSLEMSRGQILSKMAAYKSGINLRRLQKGYAKQEEIELFMECARQLKSQHIVIHDERLTFAALKAQIYGAVYNGGSTCITIDYLQLIKASSEERRFSQNEYLNDWSSDLKGIWKQTGVPIICLSQLSRLGNRQATETPPPPTLETLRGSGGIEQDADVVLMLCKKPFVEMENFFGVKDWPMILNLAKNRNGPTDTFEFDFIRTKQAFVEKGDEYAG